MDLLNRESDGQCGFRLFVLACSKTVGVMTKQELAHIARLMYDLQEYCRYVDDMNNNENCNGCAFLFDHVKCKLVKLTKDNKIPCDNWGITLEDIERLKKQALAGTYAAGITEWGRF